MTVPERAVRTKSARRASWLSRAPMAAAGVLLAMASGACEKNISDKDIKAIGVDQCRTLFDKTRQGQPSLARFIDPRPAPEFGAGHIPGALNLQLPQVSEKGGLDPALARYGELVVYGQDPSSAVGRAMTKRLIAVGYDRVKFFAGGMMEWKERGNPVEGEPGAAAKPEAPAAPR